MSSASDQIAFAKTDAKGTIRSTINGIFVNLEEDSLSRRGPYTSSLHEIGHAVDRIFGRPSDAAGLSAVVREDAETFVQSFAKSKQLDEESALNLLAERLAKGSRRETHIVSDLMSGVF